MTDREYQVAALIAEGMGAKMIAKELGLSVHTVRTHIRNIARKIPGSGPPLRRITTWYVLSHPPSSLPKFSD